MVTSNAGFLASTSTESKLRNPSSKVLNPSRRRLLRLLRLHQLSTPASSHPPQRNPSIKFRSHQSSMPVRRMISHPTPRNPSFAFRPLQTSIHVQSAFDALVEPSPSCYTHFLRTTVANESARAHRFVANEIVISAGASGESGAPCESERALQVSARAPSESRRGRRVRAGARSK